MTFLLDVNVLIALIDQKHVAHDAAHRWFEGVGRVDWASCPITENGAIRIISQPRYPNTPGSTPLVVEALRGLRQVGRHRFWADDISLLDEGPVSIDCIATSKHVTDTYLLALAAAKGGKLATLDRRLSTAALSDGAAALELID